MAKLWDTGDGICISDSGGWLPGVFDDRLSASYAVRMLTYDELYNLCEQVNHIDNENRNITKEDVENVIKERKEINK